MITNNELDIISDKITDGIIEHFRKNCHGHGYFYMSQDFYIKNIVKAQLKDLVVQEEPKKTKFKEGDLVALIAKSGSYAASYGATAFVRKTDDNSTGMLCVEWVKSDPRWNSQCDGSYHFGAFAHANVNIVLQEFIQHTGATAKALQELIDGKDNR